MRHLHDHDWIRPEDLCAEFGCGRGGAPTPCCATTLCPDHADDHACDDHVPTRDCGEEAPPLAHECPYRPKSFITLAEAYGSYVRARRVGSLRGSTLVAHWWLCNLWQCDDEAVAADALPDCPGCGVPMGADGGCGGCEAEGRWRDLWG